MALHTFDYQLSKQELTFNFSQPCKVKAQYSTIDFGNGRKTVVTEISMSPTVFANIKCPTALVREIEHAAVLHAEINQAKIEDKEVAHV